jgi:Zinc carboxypeptidase
MTFSEVTRPIALTALCFPTALLAADPPRPGRHPSQPIDEEYTNKIREYTTEPFFSSPLVDYLPASKSVPTPKAVLGDVAGAPGKLPYSAEVYRYMRMLEKASPRVKVFSIGSTEEGREMIAVASEQLVARLEENRERLARLADPRTINMNDGEAERILADSAPVYYITGAIHSPETGSPTALMELAYRLAVDEAGSEIAQHPAVIDVPVERGHVLLFSINPIWRGQTQGTYFLVFNAILNFDHLNTGRGN